MVRSQAYSSCNRLLLRELTHSKTPALIPSKGDFLHDLITFHWTRPLKGPTISHTINLGAKFLTHDPLGDTLIQTQTIAGSCQNLEETKET
jgi:hypothetical protein